MTEREVVLSDFLEKNLPKIHAPLYACIKALLFSAETEPQNAVIITAKL